MGKMGEARAGFGQVAVEPEGGAGAHGQQPAFAALALADEEGLDGRVVVGAVQAGEFGAADAGGVEEFEDGAVAQAEGVGGIWEGEDAVDFLRGEGFGEALGLFAGQVEVGGGVGGEDGVAAQPGEEPAHDAEPAELGVDHERFAGARAAVLVEVKLIGGDLRAGEVGGTAVPLVLRPFHKAAQRPAVEFDGGRGKRAGGEVVEERAGVGRETVVGRRNGWRGGGTAFAAALHGGNVDGSGKGGHGGG